jgi:nucleoside-diphosphate-sugar epimerase
MTPGSIAHAASLAPRSDEELEELLSRPTAGVVAALRESPGDIAVLGAGGKMGPSLTRMIRRAADEIGGARIVYAVSRFSNTSGEEALRAVGVRTIPADLTDPNAIKALPDVPNVIYMAGQKFGTTDRPWATWTANVVMPALMATRYADSRIVAFSTGNVYPLVPVRSGGAKETDAPSPVGEYAWSCLGRERVFEHAAHSRGTRVAIVRLNYAVDLRYGVLVDLATKVWRNEPIDLRMGWVNFIWQGDANAQAIQLLPKCAAPPLIVNVTGPELLSVRALSLELGRVLAREPRFVERESDDALLSDTSMSQSLFGRPAVSAGVLLEWVAEWVRRGGTLLGKATHFEQREGSF